MSAREMNKLSNKERNISSKLKYEGKVFSSKSFGDFVIVSYENSKKVNIKFLKTEYEATVSLGHLLAGEVKDYSQPTYYGIGVLDIREGKTSHLCYWNNMLKRCYSNQSLEKNPTYAGCEVSDGFKKFSTFKAWCNKQIGFNNEGWELDKDILIKGNKIYSEHTCCFVPREINTLLLKRDSKRGEHLIGVYRCDKTCKFHASVKLDKRKKHLGVFETELEAFLAYKQAKEGYIKVVADKWKDQIDPRVYQALITYEISVND